MTTATSQPLPASPSLLALRKSLLWRIHFWAALIATPFALLATLSGLLYVFTPQIEAVLYGKLEQVVPNGPRRNLDELVAAAASSAPPGLILRHIRPGQTASDATQLEFVAAPQSAGHATHAAHLGHTAASQTITVFINPYTGQVLGSVVNQERFRNWAESLHSSLLQGENWRWMIELAASWLMVMLATGIYLWWPRGKQNGIPNTGLQTRQGWKQWHGFLGVLLALISFVILCTGLTWSKYAGEQIRQARDYTGQKPPQVPKNLQSADDGIPLASQEIWNIARERVPNLALQLQVPQSTSGVWRISLADRSQPQHRFDLVLDAYDGSELYYAGWDKQTAFGKATAIGIPFHRGEFGWWNQALLLVFGVGILFSLISGWVMFYQRWQAGGAILPRLLPGAWKTASPGMWLTAALMLLSMPLLLLSAAALLVLEVFLQKRTSQIQAGL